MKIKMIAVDLDRTLLRSDMTISDNSIRILQSCKRRGVKVVFATARSESDCARYISTIEPDAIISNRGAIVSVGGDIIHRALIDMETTNKIIALCLKQSNVRHIFAYTDKGYISNVTAENHNPNWGEYNPDMYTDFSQGLDCDTYKITVETSDDAIANMITASFADINVVRFSGEPWYSFGNKFANKWEGIKSAAAHFGIETISIAAFGDDYSDIEMLRECGIGVAVDNAISEVKAIADYICESNDDDGVAKWLEKNICYNDRTSTT